MLAGAQTSPCAASAQIWRQLGERHAQDGGHGAFPDRHRFLHVAAAMAHGAHGILEAQGSGGHVRRVLAQAVSGGKGWM